MKSELFEIFYAKHDLLAKSQARKYWRGCKKAAIELLNAEMEHVSAGRQVTMRKCIDILEEGL